MNPTNVLFAIILNIFYDNRPMPEEWTFDKRWPRIVDYFLQKNSPIICLQEVHESFLERVKEFANSNGYIMTSYLYHGIRQCHLVTLVKKDLYLGHFVINFDNEFNKMLCVTLTFQGKVYTTVNVHLPLDIKNGGERFRVTEKLIELLLSMEIKNLIIGGDWNTIKGLGGEKQLDYARSKLNVLELEFVNNLETRDPNENSTFYGSPIEPGFLQEFKGASILDHIATNVSEPIRGVCNFIFENGIPLSDHGAIELYISEGEKQSN